MDLKKNIHPEYVQARILCACGNAWNTRASRSSLKVESCAQCHPFFTGEQRLVDKGGRMERLFRRYARRLETR
jgi:large subunit ribosomal protein L31